ncbi:hypothetical protein [Micromonospora carbonacea]|uniref:hypothetical protein n=1 Tax=Micromonospora carbonacea TaxID=47853 RepID=UPI003D736EDE
MIEMVLSPRDKDVRSGLSDAPGWSAFVAELKDTLLVVMEANEVDFLEIGELLVGQPPSEGNSLLRNGFRVRREQVLDLVVGMVDGRGPYCQLSSPEGLSVTAGWDGATHLSMPREVAGGLAGFAGDHLVVEWRPASPEPPDESRLVRDPSDEEFWTAVRTAAAEEEMALLCERWAYGAYGVRWFRLTPGNITQVAGSVSPRSLISVVVNPDLRLKVEILDDGFTAFKSPLCPGELTFRSYPDGADRLEEVTGEGYSFLLGDSMLYRWRAVVPDPDGEVRGLWEDYGLD